MKKNRFWIVVGIGIAFLLILTIVFANILTQGEVKEGSEEGTIGEILWQERAMDVFIQAIIIFAGALGVLALRPEAKT